MVREEIESVINEVIARLSKMRSLSDGRGKKARKYSHLFFTVALVQVIIMAAGMIRNDWLDVMIINLPFIIISILVGMALRSYSKEQDTHSSTCMEMRSVLKAVREYIRIAFG